MANQFDIVVIGAGAAGLMAARELAIAGLKVAIIEAAEQPGGRIATRQVDGFSQRLEMGAEFIHGHAPITFQLLKEANIVCEEDNSEMVRIQNGVWLGEEGHGENYQVLGEKLNELQTDLTIQQFLDRDLPPLEYDEVRKTVLSFSEGFELADPSRASTFAFRKEWNNINSPQYRIHGGYQQLTDFLFNSCEKAGVEIKFSSPVYRIVHQEGSAIVFAANNQQYSARKVIVTVSTGILQSGDLRFLPGLIEEKKAIAKLGFGSVIKFFLEFKEPFWLERSKPASFFISDERIPTWWTQINNDRPMLTGWLGGPKAALASNLFENELYDMAISSLSRIFSLEFDLLRDRVTHHKVICWDKILYSKGGYTYDTLDSSSAREMLASPVNETVYFAGEAFCNGEYAGTVEAALASGREVASRIVGG